MLFIGNILGGIVLLWSKQLGICYILSFLPLPCPPLTQISPSVFSLELLRTWLNSPKMFYRRRGTLWVFWQDKEQWKYGKENFLLFRLKTDNWEHDECVTFFQRNQHIKECLGWSGGNFVCVCIFKYICVLMKKD